MNARITDEAVILIIYARTTDKAEILIMYARITDKAEILIMYGRITDEASSVILVYIIKISGKVSVVTKDQKILTTL